jgi:hypothetical protein
VGQNRPISLRRGLRRTRWVVATLAASTGGSRRSRFLPYPIERRSPPAAVTTQGHPAHSTRDRFEWQSLGIISQLVRTRARLLATMVALALAGCQGLFPPPIDIDRPVIPLSKVYVHNVSDAGHHVRMNWPDGFVQVSWIEAGTTQGLTGAIGTSGFPATIDVLTEECEPVASLVGLAPGSAGIVVIDADRATLHRLDRAVPGPVAPQGQGQAKAAQSLRSPNECGTSLGGP